MNDTDSNETALAKTARSVNFDFFEHVGKPNPEWPGARTVWIDPRAAGPVANGHVRQVMPDGRMQEFKFEVHIAPAGPEHALQFTHPWPSLPFYTGQMASLCAWFRLLTVAWEKGQNPQVVFASGGGRLTAFDVAHQSTIDIGPCVLAYDNRQLVLTYIVQAALEDQFGLTQSSKRDRDLLVMSNLPSFSRISAEKYLRGDWKNTKANDHDYPRIIITHDDMKRSGETFTKDILASTAMSDAATLALRESLASELHSNRREH